MKPSNYSKDQLTLEKNKMANKLSVNNRNSIGFCRRVSHKIRTIIIKIVPLKKPNYASRIYVSSRPRGGLDHAYGGVLHLLALFFGDF